MKEIQMNSLKILSITVLFSAGLVFAAGEGSIMIHSPKDMAKIDASKKITIEYHGDAGKSGDHLHLYVNGERKALLRTFKGNVEVGPLPMGKNKICLEINTKMHVPTGAQYCVYVHAN
jgi:hypothetical protein